MSDQLRAVIKEYIDSRLREGWLRDRFEEMDLSVKFWASFWCAEMVLHHVEPLEVREQFQEQLDKIREAAARGRMDDYARTFNAQWYVRFVPDDWVSQLNRTPSQPAMLAIAELTHMADLLGSSPPRQPVPGMPSIVIQVSWEAVFGHACGAARVAAVQAAGHEVEEVLTSRRELEEPLLQDPVIDFLHDWWLNVEHRLAVREGVKCPIILQSA